LEFLEINKNYNNENLLRRDDLANLGGGGKIIFE
jgi:hypothetical protein